MNGVVLVAAGALLLAAALLAGRSPSRRRLARLKSAGRPSRASRGTAGASTTDRSGAPGGPDRTAWWRLAPVLVGIATVVMVGGWSGVVAGPLVGLAVERLVRRLPSPSVNREREAAAAELPYAVDLLAAVLKSGAPLDRAVGVVGAAVAGALGSRLVEVGRSLRLGVTGEAGWRALDDVPGADGFVPAAVRAADSGAALAAACGRCAADLRERREARAEAAAHKAGVWIVLPLGFCFLPAFVLVGVVPIVLGVLDDLLT